MPPFLTLTAIRVQNVDLNKWYNWDNGAWDAGGEPICEFRRPLNISGYGRNDGDAGSCTIQLRFGTQVLKSETLWLATGATMGFEWIGTMISVGNFDVSIVTNGNLYTDFSVLGYGTPSNPFLTLTSISVQDVDANQYYNWSTGSGWDAPPSCRAGKNVHIYAQARNDGDYGACTIQIRSNIILAQQIGVVNAGGNIGVEWTGTMPNTDYALSIVTNENVYLDFTVAMYTLPPKLTLTAIRVQDVSAQKWYNWDNGTWDATPICQFDGDIAISGYARNDGDTGQCTIELRIGLATQKTVSLPLQNGATMGFEWVGGKMTTKPINLSASITLTNNPAVNFAVIGYEGTPPTEIPWWLIGVAGVAGVGVATVVIVKRRKKKRR